MYSNEQSRINAMISYFFLGPLFLLARNGTPLREEFVRAHSLRSSLIIGISSGVTLCYSLFLSDFVNISLFSISLDTAIYAMILLVTLGYLLRGAYAAYHGNTVEYSQYNTENIRSLLESDGVIEHDEDRIRIVASMIPFLGIYIARLYPHPLVIRGRVFGSLLGSILILNSIFSGTGGIISGLVLIGSIIIFLILAVNLFIRGKFLFLGYIQKIPPYEELESHIFASLRSIGEFFRIAFGGKDKKSYQFLFDDELRGHKTGGVPKKPYFMPSGLIALPVWNLMCIPSLWIEDYREYREYILTGVGITLISTLTIYLSGNHEPILLFLLFPLVHMLSYSRTDLDKSIPITHIIARFVNIFRLTKSQLQNGSDKIASVHFEYTHENPPDKVSQ